ncbi:copia protein, partial [Tanacetum coccineum]
ASFKGFVVYQMDVKSAFIYGKIEKEVCVSQPPGFEDPNFPDKVYKVQQKSDVIFISQDKYVADILKKFAFANVKTANSDYAGASLDKKSIIGGCQFLGKRLISWQCKKQTIVANSTTKAEQTIVANSTTEAEYVAAANCCGQSSGPANLVADETIHKERGDRMERAASTASILERRVGTYALTMNPTLYASYIEQFWTSAKVKTVKEDVWIQALVDGKKVIVNETSIRRDLRLDDAEGTACLHNDTIFEELARMGLAGVNRYGARATVFKVDGATSSKALKVEDTKLLSAPESNNIEDWGNGSDWLSDVDSLTISINYVPVVAGNQTNGIARTKDNIVAGQAEKKKEPKQEYIMIPFFTTDLLISQGPKDREENAGKKPTEVDESGVSDNGGQDDLRIELERILQQEKQTEHIYSTISFNIVSPPVSTAGSSFVNTAPSSPIMCWKNPVSRSTD